MEPGGSQCGYDVRSGLLAFISGGGGLKAILTVLDLVGCREAQ